MKHLWELDQIPYPTEEGEEVEPYGRAFMSLLYDSTRHVADATIFNLIDAFGNIDEWLEANVKISIARRYF